MQLITFRETMPYALLSNLKFVVFFLKNWIVCCVSVCSDVSLHFVESPALAPPEVHIDMAAQQL